MKKKKKVILIIALVIILIPVVILTVLGIRIYNLGFAHNEDRIAKIKARDGVVDVKEIWNMPNSNYCEKYIVTFEQPLDWNNPSKGTFNQRVEVDINNDPRITVMETNGYCLNDKLSKLVFIFYPAPETVEMYDGNYVNVEQRFFGDSRPSDMSNEDTKYWEYLTPENTAKDYHKIYTELSYVLGDKWMAIGTSRGGLMCNTYGYYYPDDMYVYLAYVAPCSDGLDEERRFYDFVNNEIGETLYGEEEATAKRELVKQFQVEAMKYKNDLLPKFEKELKKNKYKDGVSSGVLYDLVVLEAGVQIWQQGFDLRQISDVLNMPEGSKKEIKAKRKAVYETLLRIQHPHDWSSDYPAWPFYVGAAKYYGQYYYDFSYLREALDEEGLADTLSVTEEMEEDFMVNIVFTEEQKNSFVYDGSFRDNLVKSMSDTKAKHLMIFGGTDPWRSVGLQPDETENENIRYYVNANFPHSSTISNIPQESREELIDTLCEWLGEETNTYFTNN